MSGARVYWCQRSGAEKARDFDSQEEAEAFAQSLRGAHNVSGLSVRVVGVTVRRRPIVQLTLSPEAIERLDLMATRCGETRSGMVERLVREAEMPRLRPGGKPTG